MWHTNGTKVGKTILLQAHTHSAWCSCDTISAASKKAKAFGVDEILQGQFAGGTAKIPSSRDLAYQFVGWITTGVRHNHDFFHLVSDSVRRLLQSLVAAATCCKWRHCIFLNTNDSAYCR